MGDRISSAEQKAIAEWLKKNSPTIVSRGVSGDAVTKGMTAQAKAKATARKDYLRKLKVLKRLGVYEFLEPNLQSIDTTLNLE